MSVMTKGSYRSIHRKMHRVAAVHILLVGTMLSVAPAIAQQPAGFPAGTPKTTVLAVCGACHDLGRVRAGYTPEGSHTVIRMMQMAGQTDAQRANSAALRITRTLVESSRQTIFGVRPSVGRPR